MLGSRALLRLQYTKHRLHWDFITAFLLKLFLDSRPAHRELPEPKLKGASVIRDAEGKKTGKSDREFRASPDHVGGSDAASQGGGIVYLLLRPHACMFSSCSDSHRANMLI